MDTVLDMLAKAGYEAAGIGDDILPCTLRKGDEPIGFLMGDLSVRLLPDREPERSRIESVLSFASDNQGLDRVEEEYKLSQYRDVLLTSSFDFDDYQPVYNIYSRQEDGSLVLLNSMNNKTEATKDYASRSGLVPSEIPAPERNSGRIRQFAEAIRQMGYRLKEARDEANRAYDITDQEGRTVGFIGKDNRVTITAENKKIKRALTNAYLDTVPNRTALPSFFEKLKNGLKKIGMTLKVVFTYSGRHYAIRNQQQQEIATVSGQKHEVTYNDRATREEMAKIDLLVDEIRRENMEKETPAAEKAESREPESKAPAVSKEDARRFAEGILENPELESTFFGVLLSNKEFVSRLNTELEKQQGSLEQAAKSQAAEKAKQESRGQAAPEKTQEEEKPRVLNESEKTAKQEFNRYYQLAQTFSGFNEEKYKDIQNQMNALFGTADPKAFQAFLQEGKFRESGSLKEKIQTSQRVADLQNGKKAAEPAKNKEREMA